MRCLLGPLLLVSLALTAPSASAAVTVGHSGWNWGTPTPQGNDLPELEFAGGRGYAAGGFGTVLRTEDAGATWTGLRTGTTQDFTRLRAIDADTFVVGGGCTLRRSDDAGQTFSRIPFTPGERSCGAQIVSFSFVSEAVGYTLLSDGTVQGTINGGASLSRRTAVPGTPATGASSGVAPTDIYFTSSERGFATTRNGAIYRTTDAAESWVLGANAPRDLIGLYFTDATTGYAVGAGNTLMRTTDGGETWTQQPLAGAPGADLTSIRCSAPTVCLITTAGGDRLFRTTDGGETATAVSPSTLGIYAAAFASPTRAVAVGQAGATVASNDAGETFTTVGSRLSGGFLRLRATSPQIVHATGTDGALARTVDGGETWTTVGVATSEDILDVSFPSATTGFVLDVRGATLRTDDGGVEWKFLDIGTTARPNALLALDPGRVLLVGPRGLRLSTDGGAVFQPVLDRDVQRADLSDADRAGEAVVAFGPTALIVSTDGGETFAAIPRPGRRVVRRPRGRRTVAYPALRRVDFITARLGYALTDAATPPLRTSLSKLWRTTDGGQRWRELPGIGTDGATELAFGDADSGWLNLPEFPAWGGGYRLGHVLRTSDGGATWRPQQIGASGLKARGLVAPAPDTGFALGQSSDLFFTRTGGDAATPSTLTLSTRTRRVRLPRKRPVTVHVKGRLEPAVGGADVVVAAREVGQPDWRFQPAQVSSSGTFTTSWRIRWDTVFVGQWRGDEDRDGDGSPALTVIARRR